MIAAIVAVDEKWGIGNKGQLLMGIPEDLKRFKKITSGGAVIMGRKTYDSLPKKPLPNRTNIIVSRKYDKPTQLFNKNLVANADFIKAWLSQTNVIQQNNGIYVIGGGEIYKELLPSCERIYVTKIYSKFKADTHFPNIDRMSEWLKTEESEIYEYNGIKYQYITYDRVDYKIKSVMTHEDNSSIDKEDMIINVECFNCYRSIIFRMTDKDHLTSYIDNWDYLKIKNNMIRFVEEVEDFATKHKVHNMLKGDKVK